MEVTRKMQIDTMVEHIEKMCEYKGDAVREGRTHLLYWLGKIEGGKYLKKDAAKAEKLDDIYEIAKKLKEQEIVL